MRSGARILNALGAASIYLFAAGGLIAQESCDDGLKELLVGSAEGHPGGSVQVEVLGGASCAVTGFSLGIGYDSGRVLFVDAVPGTFLIQYAGGDLSFQVNGRNEDGYVIVGAIFDLSFPVTVEPTPIEKDTVLGILTFEILPDASGAVPLLNRTLTFGENVPVSNVFSRKPGEAPLKPFLGDGAITIVPAPPEREFARGDVNDDDLFDISDPIVVLRHLFLGDPPALACPKSADVDDSGVLDITDPIVLVRFLFLGERAPSLPFPACGVDPTTDPLRCESFLHCE